MRKCLLPVCFLLVALPGIGQLLSWSPNFPTESTTGFTITVDASKGNGANGGLFFYTPTSDVYVHIGVITNKSTTSSDWRYSRFNWGTTPANARATSLGNSSWSFSIPSDLRTYFGITDPTESIQKIAILFRNGTGSKVQRNRDGSDMYVPVYTTAPSVRITNPLSQPTYTPIPEPLTLQIGNQLPISAVTNQVSSMRLLVNGTLLAQEAAATTINANLNITSGGNHQIIAEATVAGTTTRDTINFYVEKPVVTAPLPAGSVQGINYNPDNSVTLVLFAPGKNRVGVIGDLPGSDWREQANYQMNRTTDGNYWWVTLTGLTPGVEYSYQYIINGTLKVADPYTEKVLDPWNDPYITNAVYPGLKSYPTGKTTGIVSILQPGKSTYSWKNTSFQRPDKRNLIVYELLVRDFVANHNWNTLRDTLSYLKNLGINAIEIMPFNEFEGNESWGYNSSFYFAPDKYYGPANTLKEFIDSCHSNGIAVIMDIALNHSFGQSPMVQMYWDAANNRPAADNPWFNPVAKHAFNVGYDINHEKPETRYFVSRVVNHWLNEYKIDGFRWDLSKGFTQKQTCNNNGGDCDVAGWSAYDASRVNIWKRYYDTMQVKSPGSYCILEHFADNNEERELADYGMLLWGNANNSYSQAAMGYTSDADFSYGFANVRNWTSTHLVTYMESHDEERLMYKNLQYGNSFGSYNTKSLPTALKRMELAAAFFLTVPGPKMIWQFGELGYDYSINYCENDGTISSNCRLNNRPIRWDYFQDANRKKLYNAYSKLLKLRKHPTYANTFMTNVTEQSLGGDIKWIRLSASTGKIVVIGNFGLTTQTASVAFPSPGVWYDYMNDATVNISTGMQSFTLQAGEYFVFTNSDAALPVTITSFEGRHANHANVLTWHVSDEVALHTYEIERSRDGVSFTTAGTVTATGKEKYSFTEDVSYANVQTYFYRLKMIHADGSHTYSTIVKITTSGRGLTVQATPNPFAGSVRIMVESPVKGKGTAVLSDLSGKVLIRQSLDYPAGNTWIDLSESVQLARGTYILQVQAGQESRTLKVIKK